MASRFRQKDPPLKSWDCKGCTNICYRLLNGECIYRHEHEWYNTCDKHIGHGFEDDYFCKYGERGGE